MSFHRKSSAAARKAWSVNAHAAKARKRLEGPPPERPPERLPAGFHLGSLSWHGADGELHRWTIRQGLRANNISVTAKGKTIACGWDHFLAGLRKHLAVRKMFEALLITSPVRFFDLA